MRIMITRNLRGAQDSSGSLESASVSGPSEQNVERAQKHQTDLISVAKQNMNIDDCKSTKKSFVQMKEIGAANQNYLNITKEDNLELSQWNECPEFKKEKQRKIHTMGKTFKCTVCQNSFTRKEQLKRHSKTHDNLLDNPSRAQQFFALVLNQTNNSRNHNDNCLKVKDVLIATEYEIKTENEMDTVTTR